MKNIRKYLNETLSFSIFKKKRFNIFVLCYFYLFIVSFFQIFFDDLFNCWDFVPFLDVDFFSIHYNVSLPLFNVPFNANFFYFNLNILMTNFRTIFSFPKNTNLIQLKTKDPKRRSSRKFTKRKCDMIILSVLQIKQKVISTILTIKH